MRVIIVGAGASGLILGIRLKRLNHNIEVVIIEKNEKPGKKLLLTGNGKCNLGNININHNTYRHKYLADLVLKKYDFTYQREFFESIGVKTRLINNLEYPYHESARTFVDQLYNLAKELGIAFVFSEIVNNYKTDEKGVIVYGTKDKYVGDKLVWACGGKSYPKTGSDGMVFDLLKAHHYQITNLYPGLCPIKVQENTKALSGLRVKAKASLYFDDKLIHEENGEVLFKDDGLSGIAIFNLSSIIARNKEKAKNIRINLDLCPELNEKELINELKVLPLKSYMMPAFEQYVLKRVKHEKSLVSHIMKSLSFTFAELYDFGSAQVTVGGVNVQSLNDDLSSRLEKNVYFVGEILDNDGLCGGYNLMWAFGSALYVGDKLWK